MAYIDGIHRWNTGMANFETHWKIGLGSTLVSTLVANWLHFTDPKHIPFLVLAGLIGAIAPDIDSDTGRPLRIIFGGLAVVIPPLLLWRIPWLHAGAERALLFWGCSCYLILKPSKWLFKKFTKHRGVIHSIPAAFIFGEGVFLLAHYEQATPRFQLAIGLVGSIGYLTHLLLDEIWAVDFNGTQLRKKRSFGTALCWKDRSRRKTGLLYLALFLLGRTCWAQWYQQEWIPPFLSIYLKESQEILLPYFTYLIEWLDL